MGLLTWAMCGMTGFLAEAYAQGSLTPPAGAPSPTMKTLGQIEPRTPVASVPFTITVPGSYYFTSNLVAAASGITILTNGVTLDLMGFTLSNEGAASGAGISVSGTVGAPCRGVVIRNGSVCKFKWGVKFRNTQSSRIENLSSFDNTGMGVMLDGEGSSSCVGNVLTACSLHDNGIFGVQFYTYLGSCQGNLIDRCMVTANGATGGGSLYGGISLYSLSGTCKGNRVTDCMVQNNTGPGIHLSGVSGNVVENNQVSGFSSTGIFTEGGSGNVVVKNVCCGLSPNFNLSANDTSGPVVTSSGPLSTLSGAAELSPWANFSR